MAREVFDHSDGTLYIERTQDVEPFMDAAAVERSIAPPKSTFRKIGSIPFVFVEKILHETGRNIMDGSRESQRFVRKWLEEHKAFKSTNGRL